MSEINISDRVEALKKMRERLERELDEAIEAAVDVIEAMKDGIKERISKTIELLKMVPIDIFAVDYIDIMDVSLEADWGQDIYFHVKVPERGRYRAVLLLKKIGEK